MLFFYFSGVDLCEPHDVAPRATRNTRITTPRSRRGILGLVGASPGSPWREVDRDLYLQMDPVLGHLRERIGADTPLVVMSDHGFAPYARKFSLNTWLLEEGYLVLGGRARRRSSRESDARRIRTCTSCDAVDWSKTRAYGVGFNGLYLNLAGREHDDPETRGRRVRHRPARRGGRRARCAS